MTNQQTNQDRGGRPVLVAIVTGLFSIIVAAIGITQLWDLVFETQPPVDEAIIRTQVALEATQTGVAGAQNEAGTGQSDVTKEPDAGLSGSTVPTPTEAESAGIPAIVPSPTSSSLGQITIPGSSSEGYRFDAPKAGRYVFTYIRGSYSTYPESLIPSGTDTWLTALRVFKNEPPQWDGVAISDTPFVNFIDTAYHPSAEDAEAAVAGQSISVTLEEGDYLVFMPVDGRPYYADNPGEIVLEVGYIPIE